MCTHVLQQKGDPDHSSGGADLPVPTLSFPSNQTEASTLTKRSWHIPDAFCFFYHLSRVEVLKASFTTGSDPSSQGESALGTLSLSTFPGHPFTCYPEPVLPSLASSPCLVVLPPQPEYLPRSLPASMTAPHCPPVTQGDGHVGTSPGDPQGLLCSQDSIKA